MAAGDIIVIGGGLIGSAIAYGAARIGSAVTLLDQGDTAYRASHGNFGLVWVQSKGSASPPYASWSRDAVGFWPKLAEELMQHTGINVGLHQPGGIHLCFSREEMQAREMFLTKINDSAGGIPFQMLTRDELKERLPPVGPAVVGASYCPLDGHANPLLTLHALRSALKSLGAKIFSGVHATRIHYGSRGDVEVQDINGKSWHGSRVVIAAGLGTQNLASQVNIHAPVFPHKGQVMITERVKPFLRYPTAGVRQTDEGTVQLATTFEDVGFDDRTTVPGVEIMARDALAAFPFLSSTRIVRAWGCLRVLTPDNLPIYQESETCPGTFVATSHSGVSLAGAHAYVLAPWMAGASGPPDEITEFVGSRFLDTTRQSVSDFEALYASAH